MITVGTRIRVQELLGYQFKNYPSRLVQLRQEGIFGVVLKIFPDTSQPTHYIVRHDPVKVVYSKFNSVDITTRAVYHHQELEILTPESEKSIKEHKLIKWMRDGMRVRKSKSVS